MNLPDFDSEDERIIEKVYDPVTGGRILFIDITVFSSLLKACFEAIGAKRRKNAIDALLSAGDWIILHTDRQTDCSVYTEKEDMDHSHEIAAAKALTSMDYDVLFAPSGMFGRKQKRFDVFFNQGTYYIESRPQKHYK